MLARRGRALRLAESREELIDARRVQIMRCRAEQLSLLSCRGGMSRRMELTSAILTGRNNAPKNADSSRTRLQQSRHGRPAVHAVSVQCPGACCKALGLRL